MRATTTLLCLLLAACGGSGPDQNVNEQGLFIGPPPTTVVYIQAVPANTFPDTRLGQFTIEFGDGWVRVREDLLTNPTLLTRTICHELGHAVGVSHMTGNCVTNPDLYQQPDLVLCGPEIAQAYGMPGMLNVYVGLEPGLLEATSAACDAWNVATGRVLLAVR